MRNPLTPALAVLVALPLSVTAAPAQTASRDITIGERHSLTSNALDEERPYWVYLPASYHDSTYAPQHYPVLYLLDGDAHFHSASGVVQFMSAGINGNLQTPELIVVAIPNTNRTRDLTPTHTTVGYDGEDSAFLEASGGGDAFLRFMREELFPEIEANYRTRDYRVLVGHSFGGLIALHALLDAPDMFRSYLAIDPSLWWDEQVLVRRAERRFGPNRNRFRAVEAVYITLANNPNIGRGDPMIMRDAGMAFGRSLEELEPVGVRSAVRYFEEEDHGSVPLLSLYHGLLHLFDGYKPPMAALFENPGALGEHFARVSDELGIALLPPEALVNRLGLALLGQLEEPDKAIQVFRLNVANYPNSHNAHSSLAQAYAAADETALAIRSYERALELNPGDHRVRERLEELRSQDPNR